MMAGSMSWREEGRGYDGGKYFQERSMKYDSEQYLQQMAVDIMNIVCAGDECQG